MKAILLAALFPIALWGADRFQNFAELAAQNQENIDYRIVVLDAASETTLMAPHGGGIERGTSELLEAINSGFNTYHFMGIKKSNNFDLHITSSNFDEPRALKLAARSKSCISFHGYIGKGEKAVCIGGGNERLAHKIHQSLSKDARDFEVIYPCLKYPGKHPHNIVNRCEQGGVQLEMSAVFRDRLLQDAAFMQKISGAIRTALKEESGDHK